MHINIVELHFTRIKTENESARKAENAKDYNEKKGKTKRLVGHFTRIKGPLQHFIIGSTVAAVILMFYIIVRN